MGGGVLPRRRRRYKGGRRRGKREDWIAYRCARGAHAVAVT